jgi:dihydroorotate dehydrogenase
MIDRFDLARPILGRLPPEAAHAFTIRVLELGLGGGPVAGDDPILAIRRFGLDFANPVGLAAGFDKNAQVVQAMLRLGFGFVEIGTVTPRPQAGNPRPRIFRLPPQRAVINRLGFNNHGLDAVVRRLEAWRRRSGRVKGLVGGNIGRNKDSTDAVADFVEGARRLSPLVDYLTVNVSSPNTPGLRDLQRRAALTELLSAVRAARTKQVPVLVKIAPDLEDSALDDIALSVTETGIDGIIISNTTITRPSTLPRDLAAEAGGLSGPPLFPLATAMLRKMYKITKGAIPLVGVGGIGNADDAYVKVKAGASLIQLYTSLIFDGPGLLKGLKTGLAARLKADGFARLEDAIGADHR